MMSPASEVPDQCPAHLDMGYSRDANGPNIGVTQKQITHQGSALITVWHFAVEDEEAPLCSQN